MAIISPLANLFGKSPISPMQKHMQKVHQAVGLLDEFFQSSQAGHWDQASALQQQIDEIEHECDIMKNDLRMHLPRRMFTAIPRTSLLELITVQDQLANEAKRISDTIMIRKITFPELIRDNTSALIKTTIATSAKALDGINALDELFEVGFAGPEAALVKSFINTLDNLEDEAEAITITICQQLFTIEKELSPVDVVFMYRVIEWISETAKQAQRVGNRLQQLLA